MEDDTHRRIGSAGTIAVGPVLVYEGIRQVGADPLVGMCMILAGSAVLLARDFFLKPTT